MIKLKFRKTQAEKNAEFNALPIEKQRILIAKDVVAQIRAKKYVAESTYGRIESIHNYRDQVQDILIPGLFKKTPVCHCCGIGAGVLSVARLKNDCTTDVFNFASSTRAVLAPYFSEQQIGMIECAFEGTKVASAIRTAGNKAQDCVNYCDAIDIPANRLLAIWSNIVRNKGEFKPEEVEIDLKLLNENRP